MSGLPADPLAPKPTDTVVTHTASPAPPEPIWAKPSLATWAMLLEAVCVFIAWLSRDSEAMTLIFGFVFAQGAAVTGYYFGSSSGSTLKTQLLDRKPPTV